MTTARRIAMAAALAVMAGGAVLMHRARHEEAELIRRNVDMRARLLLSLDETKTGLLDVEAGSGQIADANDSACEIFGYKTMVGVNVADILPASFRQAHEARIKAVEKDPPHVAAMRCEALRANGETIKVLLRIHVSSNGVQAFVNRTEEVRWMDYMQPPTH